MSELLSFWASRPYGAPNETCPVCHRAEPCPTTGTAGWRWLFPHPTATGTQGDYEEYGYDLAGNRTSLRKRDGVTLTYQYGALNRLLVKNVPQSASGAAGYSVHYGYDVGNRQLYARFGSASGQGVTNVYDSLGRPSSTTTNMGGHSRPISYQYDAGGRRTRITHPDGSFFTYDYDSAARSTLIRENGGTALVSFTYDAPGRRAATAFNGALTSYGYDPISRLESISHDLDGASGDQSLGFSYNPASQIRSSTRSNELYSWAETAAGTTGSIVNGLNQLTQQGGGAVDHDDCGNLIAEGGRSFVYSSENLLTSAAYLQWGKCSFRSARAPVPVLLAEC